MTALLAPSSLWAQIFVVRDDRWAATEPAARALVNRQGENAERWLRRMRLPYRRLNASELRNGADGFFVLPANRPTPDLLAKLRNAQRVVLFAFVGEQTEGWQKALGIAERSPLIRRNGWVIVTQPFPDGLPDGEKAKGLASWLLDGANLPLPLRHALWERWREWYRSLQAKRTAWISDITCRPFRREERRRQALSLLQPPLPPLSPPSSANGRAWLQWLLQLAQAHERIHRAMAISLEPRDGEIRGIWLHTYAPTNWDAVMGTVKSANLNCLFFRAGRGGNVVYRSQFLPRDAWVEQGDLDELQNAVEAAQRYGIELHAWRVNHHFGTAPDWLKEQMAKEDRLANDPQGRQVLWLNPGDPRNQEHEFRAMLELLSYPVAGVQFDYIRYPEVPHYDFDYSEVSRREFEKATSIQLTDFPRQVLFGPLKIRYDDWQRDNITNLVRRVYYAVKDKNPQVAVSAAVWQRHRYYYALIKQDWMRWVREGILDFVCPMDYTADNDAFRERVAEQVLEVNGQIPIAVGIGAYLHADEWQLVEQVKIARDLGADGFVIFAYNIAPLPDFLEALRLGATAEPTFPTHRTPHILFALRNGLRLKDAPILYRTGDKVPFTLSVSPGLLPPKRLKEVRLFLQLERTDGFLEQVVAEVSLNGEAVREGAVVRGELAIPEGTARLVAKGVAVFTDGTTQPFVRRGPFVKGIPSSELHSLVRSLLPYRPPKGVQRPVVGVVAEGWGSENFVKILRKMGRHAFAVRVLEPTYWQAADVLLFLPLRDVRELTFSRAIALREWVEKGGRLVLLSEACGYRAHADLFPEVALVTGEREIKTIHLDKTTFTFLGRALSLQPQSGTIWGWANGAPVIVKGKVGKGVVIKCGLRVPVRDEDPTWAGWQQLLRYLLNL